MMRTTRSVGLGLATLLVMIGTACHDSQGPGPVLPPSLASLIVSNPNGATVVAAGDALLAPVVYVSLPPVSVPTGQTAVIENRRTGDQVSVTMTSGGFDPVAVPAAAGDTLNIGIKLAGGNHLDFISEVPAFRPPVVVRTEPPHRKRDVPLNAIMRFVFSEPISGGTLTSSSVQLMLNGAPVPGTLAFEDATNLIATFTPGQALTGGADYSLLITQAIEDLSGDALAAPASIEFTTQFAGSAISGIYLAQADGSGATWLVDGMLPAWSPDGNRLAFNKQGDIYLINVDGTNETRLTFGFDPAWSPDGNTIVFADGSGFSIIGTDGTGRVQVIADSLLPEGYGMRKPVFSPDGQTIAFEHFGNEFLPAQIYLYTMAQGGQPRRAIDMQGSLNAQSDPSWSADGTLVCWMYDYGIVLVDPNSTAFSSIYQDFPFIAYGAQPELSPDGSRIYFIASSPSNLWADPAGRGLYVAGIGGSNVQLLIPGGYDGDLSPDGTRLAFVRGTP